MRDLTTFADALIPVVRQAGRAIMGFHGENIAFENKSDGSPVTLADAAAEAIIVPALENLTPDIPVVSEENAESHNLVAPARFWLVDPLDGTKEFLKTDGQGAFTVNIGLIEKGAPIWGIIYAPAHDRLCFGGAGIGVFEERNGVRNQFAPLPKKAAKLTALASVSHRDAETNAWLEEHGVTHTTSIGSSLKFCLLAAAEADVYPRFSPTMEWDTAAGDAILRAAGGRMEQPNGARFVYGKPGYHNGPFIAWASSG